MREDGPKRPLWDVIYEMFWGRKSYRARNKIGVSQGLAVGRVQTFRRILRRRQMVCISSVIVVRELTMKASLSYAFELIA